MHFLCPCYRHRTFCNIPVACNLPVTCVLHVAGILHVACVLPFACILPVACVLTFCMLLGFPVVDDILPVTGIPSVADFAFLAVVAVAGGHSCYAVLEF
jgi:hypothetical protein